MCYQSIDTLYLSFRSFASKTCYQLDIARLARLQLEIFTNDCLQLLLYFIL